MEWLLIPELADTSAWVWSRKSPDLQAEFNEKLLRRRLVICHMVKMELLWQVRDSDEFHTRRVQFDVMRTCPIDDSVWARALDVFEQLSALGPLHHRQVGLPDLLIAAAAELSGIPVLHYDHDFEVIAGVTGQEVNALAPLGTL